jgi:hypothetical protein
VSPEAHVEMASTLALLIHLTVAVIEPVRSWRYLDVVEQADPASRVEELKQHLQDIGLLTPDLTHLLEEYRTRTSPSTALDHLKEWVPIVRRLLL